MDYSDPGQRYKQGMSYDEMINFSYELEQEIQENNKELAEIKNEAGENDKTQRVNDLEQRISKNEKLLQKVQSDIHRTPT